MINRKIRNKPSFLMKTKSWVKSISILGLGVWMIACGTSSNSELAARQEQMEQLLKRVESQTRFIALKVGWEDPDAPAIEIPRGNSYYQGSENPVLTLVEFSDFECPYCAQSAPVLERFVKNNADKVQLIFKHFPLGFHKNAMAAHIATLAAGEQGHFFDYRYKIAPHFRKLGDSLYLASAQDLGLDMQAFQKSRSEQAKMLGIVQEDIQLGRQIGVQGTPTLFANGKLVKNRSYAGLEALLRQAEKK